MNKLKVEMSARGLTSNVVIDGGVMIQSAIYWPRVWVGD